MFLFGKDLSSEIVVVAEVGVNHGGSVQWILDFLPKIKEAGVDAVKFQLFTPKYHTTKANQSRFSFLEKVYLSENAFDQILESNPSEVKQIRVKELVEEFLDRNDADPHLSKAQKNTMRHHLTRFAERVNRPLTVVTPKDIDEYLDDPVYAPRTRHNHRASLMVLFNYARRKGYLPDERRHAVEKSEEIRFKRPDVEVS